MTTPVAFVCRCVVGGLGLAAAAGVAQKAPAPAAPAATAAAPVAPTASTPAAEAPKPAVRKDAHGNTLRRAPTGHVTNYDEDKVPPYTLPDPLVLANGQRVRDAATWFGQRRPEIVRLYETEIYGRVPPGAPKVTFSVVEDNVTALDGAAVRQHIVGRFGKKPDGPAVNVMLYRPAHAAGPVPVVLHITFGGDPALPPPLGPDGAPVVRRFNDVGPIADVVAHGFAYAVLRYTEIQPDNAVGRTAGVIGLALAPGQAEPAPDEWGTISAWAWGLSRIMDHLATDPALDAKRVALVGHSRLGKTVLWAGATDPRFALVYSSQGGEMGSALARRDFGETVDDMAANFGYQFAGNFQKYPGHWNEMPVDAHFLIALNAPRPVFVSAGSGDQWSDPRGEFLAMVAAGPVWRLLGQPDLGTTEMPPLDTPVAAGALAYLEHNGPHVISPLDWKIFLEFAEKRLGAGKK